MYLGACTRCTWQSEGDIGKYWPYGLPTSGWCVNQTQLFWRYRTAQAAHHVFSAGAGLASWLKPRQ
ncbi:hypothetical protein M2427_005183 [Bradyrhizobium sp. BR13661]|jgi:hypothetical protein|nr:hypothetical protein [Bradyrhizobium sp. BR13661]